MLRGQHDDDHSERNLAAFGNGGGCGDGSGNGA